MVRCRLRVHPRSADDVDDVLTTTMAMQMNCWSWSDEARAFRDLRGAGLPHRMIRSTNQVSGSLPKGTPAGSTDLPAPAE